MTGQEESTSQGDAAVLVRGVSPVLQVPFTDDGEVDYDGFDRVVRYVIYAGVTSMMFPGFASEFYKLSEDERGRLTTILLSHTQGNENVAVIMAVQDHATKLAIDRAQRLVKAGADLINLLPPHFVKPSAAAIREHVCAVLEAIAPTPVVVQYAPHQTGTSLDAEALSAVRRTYENLKLVKVESEPPGAMIAALREHGLSAVVGYAGVQLPDAVRRGAVGVQPGCSFTELYVEIWRLFEAGRMAEGDALHRRLLPYISYWMLGTELIAAAEKEISVRRGLIRSAHCRAPFHSLDAEELAMIDRFMTEFAGDLPAL